MTNSVDSSGHKQTDQFDPKPSSATDAGRKRSGPSGLRSIWLLAQMDLRGVAVSWLYRGFLGVVVLLTVLQLKGMQAEGKVASAMLEAVLVTYLLVWMHGVIFISGGALTREADCLNDAILSRGVTRGEYVFGKLLSRCVAILGAFALILIPAGFWAIRQDALVRTETGFARSTARSVTVEAWQPNKIFSQTEGTISELPVEAGDEVQAGELLIQIDDRQLFDRLETARRAEEDALNGVENARRLQEEAQRGVAQAEDALARAERSLAGKDLLSKLEQADRETELRARKRELVNAETRRETSKEAIAVAERSVANARSAVRDARKRLGYASVTAPISGFVTERLVEPAQPLGIGAHLLTIAPLDDYQALVPVYQFEEFQRLEKGLKAFVTVEDTEFEGVVEKLGAMTSKDRWGRSCNFATVRFKGDGTLGLLGLDAEVRLLFPPKEERPDRLSAVLRTLTGSGEDDLETKTTSVTPFWMLVSCGKVLGCASFLVTLSLLVAVLTRSALVAILVVTGFWHISNLLFDFAGLQGLSYLEMIRTLDKVLGGAVSPMEELVTLLWLFGLSGVFSFTAWLLFTRRDPSR